jgi:lipoic acid synthetase
MSSKLNVLPDNPEVEGRGRFPSWLHHPLPKGGERFATETVLKEFRLNTVCEEAKCPNRKECYTKKTATFLALGKACTRNCSFCEIDFAKTPLLPEEDEPLRIAQSVQRLGLAHAVVTMVARDDLEDQGSSHLASIIQVIRSLNPTTTVEVLTSDFAGRLDCLDRVLDAHPQVFNHNIETVERLSPHVRHKASYRRSLSLLNHARRSSTCQLIKSGLMVGLGETVEEVEQTLRDLLDEGCEVVTIGQYLQPSRKKLRVREFIHPDLFAHWTLFGKNIGLKQVYAGPFVRSSYNASLFL